MLGIVRVSAPGNEEKRLARRDAERAEIADGGQHLDPGSARGLFPDPTRDLSEEHRGGVYGGNAVGENARIR